MIGGEEKSSAFQFFSALFTLIEVSDFIIADTVLIAVPVFPVKKT